MEFTHKKKEYSPRELYESFGDKLPLIVVCTQGFLGEKGWDTVGQGSVSFHWMWNCVINFSYAGYVFSDLL